MMLTHGQMMWALPNDVARGANEALSVTLRVPPPPEGEAWVDGRGGCGEAANDVDLRSNDVGFAQ